MLWGTEDVSVQQLPTFKTSLTHLSHLFKSFLNLENKYVEREENEDLRLHLVQETLREALTCLFFHGI